MKLPFFRSDAPPSPFNDLPFPGHAELTMVDPTVEQLRRMTEQDLVNAGLSRGLARHVREFLARRDRLKKASDLLDVKGIGPKRLELLVGYVAGQCGE